MKIALAAFVLLACVQTTAAVSCADPAFNCADLDGFLDVVGEGTIADGADCAGEPCTKQECCKVAPKCADSTPEGTQDTVFVCSGTGYYVGDSVGSGTAMDGDCDAAICTEAECCAVTDKCNAVGGGLQIASVTVNIGGTGYVDNEIVTFTAPQGGNDAKGTVLTSNGAIVDITITTAGSGFDSGALPTVLDGEITFVLFDESASSGSNAVIGVSLTAAVPFVCPNPATILTPSVSTCDAPGCTEPECCDLLPTCTETNANDDDYECVGGDNSAKVPLPAFCGTTTCTSVDCCELPTIVDAVVAATDLSQLLLGVLNESSVSDLLGNADYVALTKNLTIFAPKDNTVGGVTNGLGVGDGVDLTAADIKYHVVQNMKDTTDFPFQETLEGNYLDVASASSLTGSPGDIIMAAGGNVIYKISAVQTIPMTAEEFLASPSANAATTVALALNATFPNIIDATLEDISDANKGFTLFLPTDLGWEEVYENSTHDRNLWDRNITVLLGDVPVLTHILQHHIVPGYYFSQDLSATAVTLTTLNGDMINITSTKITDSDDESESVLQTTDILVDGGVIHLITKALVPPASKAPTPSPTEGDDDDDDDVTSPASAVVPMAVTMAAIAIIAVLA